MAYDAQKWSNIKMARIHLKTIGNTLSGGIPQ
jgi:hypothetical protein